MKSTTKSSPTSAKHGSTTWLHARKKVLRQIKKRVDDHLGKEPLELVKYRKEYEKSFLKKFKLSNIDELVERMSSSQVVFGGDFHAFSQAQRMHLKILRRFMPHEEVTIALEATHKNQNKIIESYLKSQISDDVFLEKMRWNENWGFPWENYRPLFELARERGYRIIGLSENLKNKKVSLKSRDQNAAKILVDEYKKHSTRKIYVLFGDLHIASGHLPKEFKVLCERAKLKLQTLSILLNPEKIYFKLAEKGLENKIEIVKLTDEQFCVMGSPPWVQWQSYLMFLERSTDEMLPDEDPEFDPTDEVRALVELLCSDLRLDLKLDDLAVYSTYSENLWRAIRKFLSPSEFKILTHLIDDGRSIYFPQNRIGYLARPSVNHVAELAGLYLHAKLSRRKRFFWNMPRDFEKQIWCEAMGFFISKLINHKRYSKTLQDLNSKMRENTPASEQEVLKLALDHRMSEVLTLHQMKRRKPAFKPRRKTSYLFAARILGSMMGERLYIAMQSNKINLVEIVDFLKFDPERADFLKFYLKILKWLEPVHLEMKNRRERL